MGTLRDALHKAYKKLVEVQGECSCEILNGCDIGEMTVRQIEYLKIIDSNEEITYSKLASITGNSKPTITEMVKKFIRCDYVYKQRCHNDARVYYLHLTEKGQYIARTEQIIIDRVVNRMIASLKEEEINTLITLFNKVM